jgi:hypothetical protein
VFAIVFLAGSTYTYAATTQTTSSSNAHMLMKSTGALAGPPGCPNAFPLNSSTATINYAGRTSYLTAWLWGWFTQKLNDTPGEEFAFCNQVYCLTELYGAFVSGTLIASCNYAVGEVDKRIGGTPNGTTNGYQDVTSKQVTSQIAVGKYCWANADYEPAGTNRVYAVSTSYLYSLPGWI